MGCGNYRTDSRSADCLAESKRRKNEGIVIFSQVTEGKSKINLRINYEPQGMVEKTGDAVGVIPQRVEGDLQRFKDFIEARGHESGAWRGNVGA